MWSDGDKSYVDSVVGIITDVVPVAVAGAAGSTGHRKAYRSHEVVNWVKLINTDVVESGCLVIGLGYGDGIQLFAVGTNGEARTILSRRNSSPVKDFCLLPSPPKDKSDVYSVERPLVAVCELNTVSILSLHNGVLRSSLNHNACRVVASRNAIIAACQMQIAIFSSHDFSLLFIQPTPGQVPVAIGGRWLAFAEKSLSSSQATSGGMLSDENNSYTVTVMQAAKTIKSGLTRLGETVTGNSSPPRRTASSYNQGIVSVVDVCATDTDRLLLHFQAHRDPLSNMCFDQSGSLLLTADKQGRKFHVFLLQPHPGGAAHARVDHLYVLHRGDTTAAIWDMHFSLDSRWVTVATARGTAHVFPIAPYGGSASVRTHLSSRVVNKLSRYHRSAGVDKDHDMPVIVHPSTQIRQALSTSESESGSRKGEGILMSVGFSSGRACWLSNNKMAPTGHNATLDSLFVVTTSGTLSEYRFDVRPQQFEGIRPSDQEMGIEVAANVVAQWHLLHPNASVMTSTGPPKVNRPNRKISTDSNPAQASCWMSQVEIVTYASPHRRLWMGPQFTFKPMQGGTMVVHDPAVDCGLVEVECNSELIAEHIAEAMSDQSVTVHSSADSLYHSPSQSSEHLLIFDGDMESL